MKRATLYTATSLDSEEKRYWIKTPCDLTKIATEKMPAKETLVALQFWWQISFLNILFEQRVIGRKLHQQFRLLNLIKRNWIKLFLKCSLNRKVNTLLEKLRKRNEFQLKRHLHIAFECMFYFKLSSPKRLRDFSQSVWRQNVTDVVNEVL